MNTRTLVLALAATGASAFAPTPLVGTSATSTIRSAEEGEGMDLDLDDMFNLFDEAEAAAPVVAGAGSAAAVAIPVMPGQGMGTSSPTMWDPLGFSSPTVPGYTRGWTREYFQEVEIKHGRVAMLAASGFVIAEKFHPLFGGSIEAPSYLAFQQTPLQTFWPVVVGAIGFIEFQSSVPTFEDPSNGMWKLKGGRMPGDLGFDPMGLKPKDEAALFTMRTKEIMNGRVAMLAIAGMVCQELATGAKL